MEVETPAPLPPPLAAVPDSWLASSDEETFNAGPYASLEHALKLAPRDLLLDRMVGR